MNLLLFTPAELVDATLVLRDHRLRHLREILHSNPGDTIRVGEINGPTGTATVRQISEDEARLSVELGTLPPAPLPLTVVLALPRPKMLRRILRTVAETGVKELHLIHSYRVEKSYWQSPLLNDANCHEAFIAGLEQGMDTVLPALTLHRRFRPFAEDVLPGLCRERRALLADHRATQPYPAIGDEASTVVIGPEGGFIPFERELIATAGATPVSLGPRSLRVETALGCCLGRHLG